MAVPAERGDASISFTVTGSNRELQYVSTFSREDQAWTGKAGRPHNPGLVIYAMADGSFAVWDPHRNYWKKSGGIDVQDRQPAYVFTPREVWDGLSSGETVLCNGLLSDWASWQREGGRAFRTLVPVLESLTESGFGPMAPGELRKLSLDDARLYPTLVMPYGTEVPLHHCSAGMRRIFALAYLLVWAWEEHIRSGELLDRDPTGQITFIVDEIESHLHPRWQRTIASSILNVMRSLSAQAEVQLIASTHSPLVLASLETIFKPEKDAWFDFDLVRDENANVHVQFVQRSFLKRGDATSWLTSDAFDLKYGVSAEAENVLVEADKALKNPEISSDRARSLDDRLKSVLSETDPFWLRWRFVADGRGWLR
jgi:hypothetical protein